MSIKISTIDGVGVFADQRIPKGTVTWKFTPKFDLTFDVEEIERMTEMQKLLVKKFAFFSKKSKKYIYSIDNSRFANHSKNNNIDFIYSEGEPEGHSVSNKDIEVGEEMTINYQTLDGVDENGSADYLR